MIYVRLVKRLFPRREKHFRSSFPPQTASPFVATSADDWSLRIEVSVINGINSMRKWIVTHEPVDKRKVKLWFFVRFDT